MLNRWNPFAELEAELKALRRDVEHAFEESGIVDRVRPLFRASFLPGRVKYPLVNVGEDDENVYVEALTPGAEPESLEVSVLGGKLRIAGERPPITPEIKPEAFHRNERDAGPFTRTVALPAEVESDEVSAEYKNGVLLVTLPKAESAKPKQVVVDVK